MEMEQRVKTLEYEIKILKNEIQRTLLDIQEQILNHSYPALRTQDPSAPAAPAPRPRPVVNSPTPTVKPVAPIQPIAMTPPQPATKSFAASQPVLPPDEAEEPKISIRKVSLDEIRAAKSEPLPPPGMVARGIQNEPIVPAAVFAPAAPSQPLAYPVQPQPVAQVVYSQPPEPVAESQPIPIPDRRKATPPSGDLAQAPKLLDWALGGAAHIGGERFKALAHACASQNILTPEMEQLVLKIAPLNRRSAPATVGTDEILEVMLQLDAILERPADQDEARRVIQEAQLG